MDPMIFNVILYVCWCSSYKNFVEASKIVYLSGICYFQVPVENSLRC